MKNLTELEKVIKYSNDKNLKTLYWTDLEHTTDFDVVDKKDGRGQKIVKFIKNYLDLSCSLFNKTFLMIEISNGVYYYFIEDNGNLFFDKRESLRTGKTTKGIMTGINFKIKVDDYINELNK